MAVHLKAVIVLTRRPVELRHGAEAFAGPVTELVSRLAGTTRVYVDGADVIRQNLISAKVIDISSARRRKSS